MTDFDVAVVGTGVAGLAAGLMASESGASILMVDAQPEGGGRSQFSTGMIMAAGTRFQRERGIEDNPEDLFRHYMTLNQWKVRPGVVKRLCEEAGPAVEWAADLGLEILDVYFSGDEDTPRGHITNGGHDIVRVLRSEARKRSNIEWAFGQRVDRLVTTDGRVTGIESGGDQISVGAVVLATGGFVGNESLYSKYLPSAVEGAGEIGIFRHPGPDVDRFAQGDIFELVEPVGAQIAGFDRYLTTLDPGFAPEPDSYLPGWLVIVNQQGRRFYDEMAPYSVVKPLIQAQEGPVYVLFDDAAKRAAQPKSSYAQRKVNIPGELWEDWVEPVIDENVAKGRILKKDTLEELALELGIPAQNLLDTVAVYNRDVELGEDSMYLKKSEVLAPIKTGPFYAMDFRLRRMSVTCCGPAIDRDARVLTPGDAPIPGLYAAGECVGTVLGDVYVGSGNSLANCLTFGRVAGRSAAAEVMASVSAS